MQSTSFCIVLEAKIFLQFFQYSASLYSQNYKKKLFENLNKNVKFCTRFSFSTRLLFNFIQNLANFTTNHVSHSLFHRETHCQQQQMKSFPEFIARGCAQRQQNVNFHLIFHLKKVSISSPISGVIIFKVFITHLSHNFQC